MRKDVWEEFVKALAANPQGFLLFLMGSTVITALHLIHRKEIIRGAKGANGLFEPSEWLGFVFSWVWPNILIGSACGIMVPPDWVWYFMGFILVYVLMGNKGVEAILAWRGIGSTKSETTTSTTVTASQESTKAPQ